MLDEVAEHLNVGLERADVGRQDSAEMREDLRRGGNPVENQRKLENRDGSDRSFLWGKGCVWVKYSY